MIYKIQAGIEATLIFATIHWQPLFGIISACVAAWYYLAMLKINVVDVKFEGSWKKYIKSLFKRS